MSSTALHERDPASVPGDFYVENNCCISCGVPQMVAPDLIGWAEGGRSVCYWKKQPETADELRQALAVFDAQEVGCHRYAGSDAEIKKHVGPENCDYPSTMPRVHLQPATAMLRLLVPESPGFLRKLLSVFKRPAKEP